MRRMKNDKGEMRVGGNCSQTEKILLRYFLVLSSLMHCTALHCIGAHNSEVKCEVLN